MYIEVVEWLEKEERESRLQGILHLPSGALFADSINKLFNW